MNEASTLIQNAAHEDANIIFGAVLDETMGDDVKITVIATGFRQEQPERRERLLSNAALPGSRPELEFTPRIGNRTPAPFASEVRANIAVSPSPASPQQVSSTPAAAGVSGTVGAPLAPRVATPRSPASEPMVSTPEPVELHRAHFREDDLSASEETVAAPASADIALSDVAPPSQLEAPERSRQPAAGNSSPELRPVPASVFDDDFFRRSEDESQSRQLRERPALRDLTTTSFVKQGGVESLAGGQGANLRGIRRGNGGRDGRIGHSSVFAS